MNSSHPASASLFPGFKPENYDRGRKLGKGSGGTVREYTSRPELPTGQPKDVACKKVTLKKTKNGEKWRREYQILTKVCDHKNILKLYFWQVVRAADGSSFLMLYSELCHQNLKTFLAENKLLRLYDVKKLGRQLLQGCEYLHSKKIVHRDIKPGNILIIRGDIPCRAVVKLGDFGLARDVPDGSSMELTAVGTNSYASPEMSRGIKKRERALLKKRSDATDIFSMGVVIYEMITGKRPFSKNQLCSESFDGEDTVSRNVSNDDAVKKVLTRMLHSEPEKRPRASEVLKEFTYGHEDLYIACDTNDVEVFKELHANNIDITKFQNGAGSTPLCHASRHGRLEVATFLLETGTEVNQADENGLTPLLLASQNGHTALVQILMDRNALVNQTNKNGEAPLYSAAQNGHVEIARLLLQKGADVDHAPASDKGCTALYVASQYGHADVVRLLLEYDADVNQARTDCGITPLYISAQNGHPEVINILLEKGARVNQGDNDSVTPLYVASLNGRTEIVKLLLSKKADTNHARSKDSSTPLYIASYFGHTEIVRLLLLSNADVKRARTKSGWSPLFVASFKGHMNVVKLLESHIDQS